MNLNPKAPGPYTTITVTEYRHLRDAIECATDLALAVQRDLYPVPVALEEPLAKFVTARERL